jgi:hypothetical protein
VARHIFRQERPDALVLFGQQQTQVAHRFSDPITPRDLRLVPGLGFLAPRAARQGCHPAQESQPPGSAALASLRVRTCVRMTSDGSAVMRLQRALANPRTSAAQIRAVASELPTVGLEDALAILLALLDREPQSFSRTAARWGARLTIERRLPLADAQLTLASLAVLPGAGAQAGAEALIELASRYDLRRVDELLGGWLRRRSLGD